MKRWSSRSGMVQNRRAASSMESCSRSAPTTPSSCPIDPMTRRRPSLILIFTLGVLCALPMGCMREEEDREPPFWYVEATQSASRRYAVDQLEKAEGDTETRTTRFVLKRRGTAWLLTDHKGNRLGKASVRRSAGKIVIRDPDGDVIGSYVQSNRGIEVQQDDKVVAALEFEKSRKRFVLSIDGVPTREFVRDGEEVRSRRLDVENAPVSVARADEKAAEIRFVTEPDTVMAI